MADFRKLLLVLIAGAFLFAAVASADNYACSATAVPTLARAEGLAEQMGDVLLKCGGTVPAGGLIANIRLTLTTYDTSPSRGSFPNGATVTDATMILDEGMTAAGLAFKGYPSTSYIPYADGTQNVYQAVRISDTEVEWQAVVLAGPSSAGGFQTIRLTNVRGNANRLGSAGNATIQAYVNITAPTAVPVNNNLVTVADTRVGLTFSVTGGSFKNCVLPYTIYMNFKEGFSNAFRPAPRDANGVINATSVNNSVGGPYANESGWNPGTLSAGVLSSLANIGVADQGTRFIIRVKNNPSGISLTFPDQYILSSATGSQRLQIVSSPNADGSGGTITTDSSSTTFSASAFLVVYEVFSLGGNSISYQETLSIPVGVSYAIPGPLGTATVSGTFAPLSTIAKPSDGGSNVDFLRALSPRFIDTAVDNTWYTINPCRTILLFPYITQQGLFDTGIAISNTTMDPWGTLYPKTPTVPQNGACRLFYYGNTNGGAAPSNNPPQTSPIIPAGAQLVFQLSGGGGVYASGGAFTACAAGACVAPLFQGYLFAICDFQYAHGYAFISDYGAQKLAQGYLALVVPDFGPREPSSRSITAFTDCITGSCTNVGLNEGEQLEN